MLMKDAIVLMKKCTEHSVRRFDLEFTQLDKERGTGGRPRKLVGCYICGTHHDSWEHGTITVRTPHESHPISVHLRLIWKINGEWVQ